MTLISISELFKKSFEFYTKHLKLTASLMLIVYIPALLSEVVGLGQEGRMNVGWPVMTGFGLIFLVVALVYFFISLWVKVALYHMLKLSNSSTPTTLLKNAKSDIWPYAWISFLAFLYVVGGLLLFIIPGIIFAVWVSLVPYVLFFEGVKNSNALWKSKELVKGYWWPVLGRWLAFGALALVVSAIPWLGQLLAVMFFSPMSVFYGYFIYEDLKRVKSSPTT